MPDDQRTSWNISFMRYLLALTLNGKDSGEDREEQRLPNNPMWRARQIWEWPRLMQARKVIPNTRWRGMRWSEDFETVVSLKIVSWLWGLGCDSFRDLGSQTLGASFLKLVLEVHDGKTGDPWCWVLKLSASIGPPALWGDKFSSRSYNYCSWSR